MQEPDSFSTLSNYCSSFLLIPANQANTLVIKLFKNLRKVYVTRIFARIFGDKYTEAEQVKPFTLLFF